MTIALAIALLAAASPVGAEASFEVLLRDQYGGRVALPTTDPSPVVTVLAFADRAGAEANRRWAERFVELYRDHLEERSSPALRIVAVAHLKGVPFFVRGLVRRGFRGREPSGERTFPIGLDWKGDVARQLGFTPGVPNLAVFDPSGRLRAQTAAEADDEQAATLFTMLEELLQNPTRSAAK